MLSKFKSEEIQFMFSCMCNNKSTEINLKPLGVINTISNSGKLKAFRDMVIESYLRPTGEEQVLIVDTIKLQKRSYQKEFNRDRQ